MTAEQTAKLFTEVGGEFTTSPILLSERLKKIKVLLFDWDGVWHDGRKTGNVSSFSEVDSMGLNLLRFGYNLQHGTMPLTFIITGENNVTAFDFAKREHIDAVFFQAKNKIEFFDFILEKWAIQPEEVLFAFDDVLDLAVAEKCGVRFLINRTGSPLLHNVISQHEWCDYKTASNGGTNGVRELCELAIGLLGKFEEVVNHRMNFSATYMRYWEVRNQLITQFYTKTQAGLTQVTL
jgi:3-deoxy-D-manno-octulosonate 8-phosphate phosphatase (KDO 8-P phosphatase)